MSLTYRRIFKSLCKLITGLYPSTVENVNAPLPVCEISVFFAGDAAALQLLHCARKNAFL
jgi:hypothetical protein